MKVTVIDVRNGRTMYVPTRVAKLLINRGRAVLLEHGEIELAKPLAKKPAKVKKPVAEKKTKDLKADGSPKKKAGRPAKQTYETKDMVAKVK